MKSSLIVLASALALGAAQMTFSDGWEKRQPNRPYAHHYAHQKVARSGGHSFTEADPAANVDAGEKKVENAPKNTPKITEISKCMEDYMAGVREMHAAMMALYKSFETCENTNTNPLLRGSHEKTTFTRF